MALEAFVSFLLEEVGSALGGYLGEVATPTARDIGGYLGDAWHLKDNLEKLERILDEIQPVLADAEEKQKQNNAVRKWLNAVKKAAYDAEDVVDQFNYRILRGKATKALTSAGMTKKVLGRKVRNIFSSRNPIIFPVKMGRKLKNILKRIEKINSRGRRFDFVKNTCAQPQTTWPMREKFSFVGESDVVGRDEDREKIVTKLLENSQHLAVLPIVGMGGIGKTTMAQLIYNDPRVMDHFKLREWVCVSNVWGMKNAIQHLIVSITGQNRELPTLELKQRAVREALIGKRYLIVLDDIWKENRVEWNNLRSILNCDGIDGSAIIVTTGSRRVAEITGTIQTYALSTLTESASWTLFCSKAFASGSEKPEELVEIGKDIVKKCGGLPLAIKMLGSSLYMKTDRRDWLKIRDSSLWNVEESDDILPALRLSYKHLPPYTKRCFAFCATFPKDYLIEKEMLIQMWMAHGFIPSSERFVVDGHEIFNQLVQRSFFHDVKQDGKIYFGSPTDRRISITGYTVTTCRMHDLVHDLAQSIVGQECKSVSRKSLEDAAPKFAYHLYCHWGELDIDQMFKASPKLRTLLYHGLHFAPLNISSHIPLRVLRFHHCSELPNSTKSLQHLRYLDLSFSNMEELPESICTLHHLQTLNLFGCEGLRELPESICQLLNLQTLILHRCKLLYRLPESICTLLNLHTLDLTRCDGLSELPERIHCLSALRNLRLYRCYNLKKMPAGMRRMTNLEALTAYVVCDEDGRGIEELKGLGLSSIFEIFNLRYVKDAKDAGQVNLHSKVLHDLTLHWRGRSDSDTNSNEENAEKVLEELKPPGSIKKLKIHDYNGLSFPAWILGCLHLVQLHLESCSKLRQLPPLWRLKSLEVLTLRGLDELNYIIAVDNAEDDTTVQTFPALRELILDSLGCLEDWSENRNTAQALTNCFPSLVYLEITNSTFPESNISSFSGTTMDVCLPPQLNELHLDSCKSPTTLMLRCPASLKSLSIDGCPNLVSLTAVEQEVSQLTSLGSISISGCRSLESLAIEMGRLPVLKVSDCDELKSLEIGGLTALKRLYISKCTELTSLPERLLRYLPSLEELSIEGCPELEKKCRSGGDEKLKIE